MMGIDAARAGDGVVSNAKSKKKEDSSGSEIFQSEDENFRVKVPEGWKTKK